MSAETGDARIRVPDQVVRGELITVNAIVSHPMERGVCREDVGRLMHALLLWAVVVQ